MFKVNNKYTRPMPGVFFGVFIVNLKLTSYLVIAVLLLSLDMLLSIEIGPKVQFLRDTISKCTESSKETIYRVADFSI